MLGIWVSPLCRVGGFLQDDRDQTDPALKKTEAYHDIQQSRRSHQPGRERSADRGDHLPALARCASEYLPPKVSTTIEMPRRFQVDTVNRNMQMY